MPFASPGTQLPRESGDIFFAVSQRIRVLIVSLLPPFFNKRRLVRSPCCLSFSYQSVSVHLSVYPLSIFEAYEITLLSVCLRVPPTQVFWFSVRSVLYQMKVGDLFFPELLVYIMISPWCLSAGVCLSVCVPPLIF
jgi:hypothetical protein